MPWKQRIAMAALGRSDGLNERLFDQVFNSLSPLHQQILRLYFIEDTSMAGISTILQMSSKVARTHMKDALGAFNVSGMLTAAPVYREAFASKMKTRYYPRAEYKDGVNLRLLSKKEYYGTVEEAVAVINNWSQMYTILWAWIEVVEGRAKLNRITLKKNGEGWEAPTTRP